MDIELNEAETAALRRILDEYLPELSYEIADTDSYDYRQELKEYRSVVQGIRERLGDGDATG